MPLELINPIREVRAFVRAALVVPVPRNHQDSDAAFRRRQVVALVTLLIGTAVLTTAVRIPAGDRSFYVATSVLAVVWATGGLLSGPLHLGRAHTRSGSHRARPVVQSLALGALLLAVFLLGGLVVARVPWLRDPVTRLLDHARLGSLSLVVVITAVNGAAEELYFRGALYAAVGRHHPVLVTAGIYALTTVGSGIPLLVLAGAALGLLTGLQRRVTGGVLAPIITHLTWSLGMLLLLPYFLGTGG